MGCTIGAIRKGGRTFLLQNLDRPVCSFAWADFRYLDGYDHFALVSHYYQGVGPGLNVKGLALIGSFSDILYSGRERKKMMVSAELLSKYDNAEDTLKRIKEYAEANPNEEGGNIIVADPHKIAIIECFEGKTNSDIIEEGYIARANHSILGTIDYYSEDTKKRYEDMDTFFFYLEHSKKRYESMRSFLDNLFRDFPPDEEIIKRCKVYLRSEPVLYDLLDREGVPAARTSFVIDVQNQRVDYKLEDREWKVWLGKKEKDY